VKFAYADPPYLGQGVKHYGDRHADAADCDTVEWHAALVQRLCDEFPDGWALSLHTPSLKTMLNLCPDDVRVGAWVKPFAAFKKNVTRAYAWEPVILRGGRPIPTTQPTVRDWVSEPIAMLRGFPGAKPAAVCWWIFDWLNLQPEDDPTSCEDRPQAGHSARADRSPMTTWRYWWRRAPMPSCRTQLANIGNGNA
jgi:hypothetical protein